MIIDYSPCESVDNLESGEKTNFCFKVARRTLEGIGRKHWWACGGAVLLNTFMASIPDGGMNRIDLVWQIAGAEKV
jgi:hypothetical protein